MKKLINTILTLLILYELSMIGRNTYLLWDFSDWGLLGIISAAMIDMVFVIGYALILILNKRQRKKQWVYSAVIMLLLSIYAFYLGNPFVDRFNLGINPYSIAWRLFHLLNWLLLGIFVTKTVKRKQNN